MARLATRVHVRGSVRSRGVGNDPDEGRVYIEPPAVRGATPRACEKEASRRSKASSTNKVHALKKGQKHRTARTERGEVSRQDVLADGVAADGIRPDAFDEACRSVEQERFHATEVERQE